MRLAASDLFLSSAEKAQVVSLTSKAKKSGYLDKEALVGEQSLEKELATMRMETASLTEESLCLAIFVIIAWVYAWPNRSNVAMETNLFLSPEHRNIRKLRNRTISERYRDAIEAINILNY